MSDAVAEPLTRKLERVRHVLRELESVLVAYSGGIDSTLVFKIAHDTLDDRAVAVTAVSPTLPASELHAARRLAAEIGGRHLVVHTDQLAHTEFVRNDASRCYHCKTDLYQVLSPVSREHALNAIVDGTHADDLGDDRAGLAAAREWGVRSPLLEAGCSKQDIRGLARMLGLSNWDKPAAACLSSRIPRGIEITRERLSRVERAEAVLLEEGFQQIRVRDEGDLARIELAPEEFLRIMEPERRARILEKIKRTGFRFVTLDLEGYRRGSTNAP